MVKWGSISIPVITRESTVQCWRTKRQNEHTAYRIVIKCGSNVIHQSNCCEIPCEYSSSIGFLSIWNDIIFVEKIQANGEQEREERKRNAADLKLYSLYFIGREMAVGLNRTECVFEKCFSIQFLTLVRTLASQSAHRGIAYTTDYQLGTNTKLMRSYGFHSAENFHHRNARYRFCGAYKLTIQLLFLLRYYSVCFPTHWLSSVSRDVRRLMRWAYRLPKLYFPITSK